MAISETNDEARHLGPKIEVDPLPLPFTPTRILLLRVDRVGDMLVTTPALRALRHAYGDARIDLVASDLNRAVVVDNPHIDRLWTLRLRRQWQWPWLLLQLRSQKYDLAVDLNTGHSRTSGMFVRYSGALERVSFKKTRRKRLQHCFDHTIPLVPGGHHVENQLRMARALGADALDPRLEFIVPQQAHRAVGKRFGPVSGAGRVCVFIGNAKKARTRWPIEKFVALTRALSEIPTLQIVILAGPSDKRLVSAFDELLGANCVLMMSTSLAETGALLQTCRLVVTSSSGPMHLAGAVGTATLSILAGSTYTHWRPLGAGHSVVRAFNDGTDVRSVPVDAVLQETRRLLGA